jgi:hypothetical protein
VAVHLALGTLYVVTHHKCNTRTALTIPSLPLPFAGRPVHGMRAIAERAGRGVAVEEHATSSSQSYWYPSASRARRLEAMADAHWQPRTVD